jgi:hypothetical protein
MTTQQLHERHGGVTHISTLSGTAERAADHNVYKKDMAHPYPHHFTPRLIPKYADALVRKEL